MKTIAMYLPQFHETIENNMWWGQGYTEWTAVKSGTPLFSNHIQPKKPLNDNYYNLLERNTLKSHADLAKEYGIYGFCFYHYWFEDGKKILEKPAENLLKWKDIDIPFCFCWANQTWARSWSKIQGANTWTTLFEKEDNEKILMKQRYGREEEWREHFDYLLPFLKDSRYIKIEGKPVLILYKTDDVYCLSQMLRCWNKEAIKAGLAGIYMIGESCSKSNVVDAVMNHQPATVWAQMLSQVQKKNGISVLDYEQMWINIIDSACKVDKDTFFMGFTGFDNTPRHGKNGLVVEGASPSIFEKYFGILVQKSIQCGNKYIFLNAWNEWGEGMYLEPDEENGYAFLESHRRTMLIKNMGVQKPEPVDKKTKCNLSENKIHRYYKLLNEWMYLRGGKKCLLDYLIKHKYFTIAIYGMGDFGRHLLQEVEASSVEVKYVIDRRKVECSAIVLTIEDKWPQVDAIIVTPFLEFESILELIEGKINCAVLSIEEMISEIA